MTKKLYFNGNVITVNNKEEVVQAVAIEDGKIIKVGTNEEILSLKDNDTEVIDLEGKTMLPGFIDPPWSHSSCCTNFNDSYIRRCNV